jgi:hypothetical protein
MSKDLPSTLQQVRDSQLLCKLSFTVCPVMHLNPPCVTVDVSGGGVLFLALRPESRDSTMLNNVKGLHSITSYSTA